MAENPLRKPDRILQKKAGPNDAKRGITLFDVDYAIMSYLEEVVLPTLDDNGKALKIPVIYGNSERWKGARRDGIYRDSKGKLQLPLLMIRRTSVAKNDAMPMLNRHVSYQTVTKWSKDNRYSRFSLLTNQRPKYELHNTTMPDYVEINYECMGWTSFTEQLNIVIESLTWASDEYWGDKTKFKFNTTISDYNVVNEVGEGTERINRVEFTLNVRAYLIPEKFDGEDTTKKSFSLKSIIVSTETDLTSNGRFENLLINPPTYYENVSLSDFLSSTNTITKKPIVANTITFSGIKLIPTPNSLGGIVTSNLILSDISYDIKIYKNGIKLNQNTDFTVIYSEANSNIVFNFTNGLVTTTDDMAITGKFIIV